MKKTCAILLPIIWILLCGFDRSSSNPSSNGLVRHYPLETDIQSGTVWIDISCASPPAVLIDEPDSGTEPFFTQPSANDTHVGPWGIYIAGAIDNLLHRNYFETWSGSHPACGDNPTGYGCWCVAGDGSSAMSSDTSSSRGTYSIKTSLTGTTSYATCSQSCFTDGIGSDIYLSMYAKATTSTDTSFGMQQFSDGSCSTSITASYFVLNNGTLTTDWTKYNAVFLSSSWNGATNSYQINLYDYSDNGVSSYFDAMQLRVAGYPTDAFAGCDSDAICSTLLVNATLTPQPLTSGTWVVRGKVRTPIDGAEATPVRYVLMVPGTAGNNNRIDLYWASDVLTFDVYDSSGTKKTATIAAAGNADTQYSFEAKHTYTGDIKVCWDGTCGTAATGATMDGISATCRLGHNGTDGGEVWIQGLKFFNRMIGGF